VNHWHRLTEEPYQLPREYWRAYCSVIDVRVRQLLCVQI